MQEFAPTKSRFSGECPSDEELAAYIDGALDKEEGDRVTEHLLSCERCYEIYAETVRFQLDSKRAPEGKVMPFPSPAERSRPVLRWLPFAALLLLGIGAGRYFLASPPALTPRAVTASFQGKPGGIGNFWVGPTTRGGGDETEDKPYKEASFQMGVQLVNLQLSLEAKNAEEARGSILPRIRQVLDTQSAVSPLVDSFTALSADLESKPPGELLGKFSQVAHECRDYFDEPFLDLGQWVEAGRMAALTRNPSFFQQSDTQSFLRQLRWRDKLGIGDTKLDPVSRESLGRISEIVSKDDLQGADYAELKQQFDKILDKYYPDT